MAYVRKTKTPEELSAARAAAGRIGASERVLRGHSRGGRKKNPDTDKMSTLSCHKTDIRYVSRLAFLRNVSKAACVRALICQYRLAHPDVKVSPEDEARLDKSAVDFGRLVKKPEQADGEAKTYTATATVTAAQASEPSAPPFAAADLAVLDRYAALLGEGKTAADALHRLCRVVLNNHPEIELPEGWTD